MVERDWDTEPARASQRQRASFSCERMAAHLLIIVKWRGYKGRGRGDHWSEHVFRRRKVGEGVVGPDETRRGWM